MPGAPGTFGVVAGGWVQTYEGCDIYYSEATGAHEVHGDIRAKYNFLGDESPENIGLEAPVETLSVSGWGYDFHRSQSRIVTFRSPAPAPLWA